MRTPTHRIKVPGRKIEVQIEIKADIGEAMREGKIEKLLKKIQAETKDFPHVKVKLDIT